MWNHWLPSIQGARRRVAGAALLITAAMAPAVWAQGPESAPAEPGQIERLAEELAESFEVLPSSGGVVLRPHEGSGRVRTVEVGEGGVSVDGERIGEEALLDLLGPAAGTLVELAGLTPEDRRRVYRQAGLGGPEVEAPEPPEPPEPPDEMPEPFERRVGERVAVFEDVVIEEGEVAQEVVVIAGSLIVRGRVRGEVVVVGGSAQIDGEVSREVVVVGGSLKIGPEARIGSDVQVVGGSLERHPEARIEGAVNEVAFGPWGNWEWGDWGPWGGWTWFGYFFGVIGKLLEMAAFALLLAVVLLIAPGPVGRVEEKAVREPAKALVVGLASFIGIIPLTLLFVVLTLCIGILAVPFIAVAFVIMALLGYAAVALRVGRLVAARTGWKLASPYAFLFLGVVAVEVWGLLEAISDLSWGPFWLFSWFLGAVAWIIALAVWSIGFGAVVLTWIDHNRAKRAAQAVPPLPPPSAPPAAPVTGGPAETQLEPDPFAEDEPLR